MTSADAFMDVRQEHLFERITVMIRRGNVFAPSLDQEPPQAIPV